MGINTRRAHSAAARILGAILPACLVLSSPGGAWALEALGPTPRALQAPLSGAVKELYDDFAALLARQNPAPAGMIVEKGRQFRRHLAGSAALDEWLSSRLEGPLAGFAYWSAPARGRLDLAVEGLPQLRSILAGNRTEGGAGKAQSLTQAAGDRVSRLLDAFKGALPSAPGEDLVGPTPEVMGAVSQARAGDTASVGVMGDTTKVVSPPQAPKVPPEPPELAEMRRVRDALYEAEKLSQKRDIASPADEQRARDIRDLDELIKGYEAMLGETGVSTGMREADETDAAWLKSMQRMFEDFKRPAQAPLGAAPPLTPGTTTEQAIEARVKRIEDLKKEVQSGLAARDSTAAAVAMADRARSGALRDRRSGKEMLEFRKNFARLAMVMDLTYGLNLLNSLDKALAGMQEMLDQKLARIIEQRKANAAGAAAAEEQKRREEEWRKQAQANVDEDRKNSGDFAKISDQAGKFVPRVEEFRTDVANLLAYIDARDKGQSAGARAEYARRLALLPGMQQNLIHGGGGGSGGLTLSLDELKKLETDVDGYIRDSNDAEAKLGEVPLEFAGVLVLMVPSDPPVNVTNPGLAEILQILAARRVHWLAKTQEIQDMVDNLRKAMDPSNTRRVVNDFGDSIPESLMLYLAEQRDLAGRLRSKGNDLGGRIDILARSIRENVPSINLPTLAGRSADELRDLLPTYADALEGVEYPDTDGGFQAQMDKLSLVKLLPFLGDNTVMLLEAEGTVKALEEATVDILPKAQAAAGDALAALQEVVRDIGLDEAFVNSGSPSAERQALIDRKRNLVMVTLRPMLIRAKAFLNGILIPFQEKRIRQADPNSTEDSLAVLYKEKDKFFVRIDEALKKKLPWGLASNGAREGDVAGARVKIEKFRKKFSDYQQLVVDLQDSVRRREDPSGTELEDVYGEQAPYSLVVREKVYREEKVVRAGQFNARAAQFNAILRDMDAVPGNNHNLAARLSLPVDIAPSGAASVAKLKAIADNDVLQNAADEIKAIADAASAAAGGGGLTLPGGNGSIPTGTQPPVELPPELRLALLGLEAIKRLVPTTTTPSGDSIAETLARYLFSDALMESAITNLRDRIPVFKAFLNKAAAALADIFADCDADLAYVAGDLSGGELVLARKIRVFTRIRDTAKEGADLFLQKAGWSAEAFQTVTDVTGYYDSLNDVYTSGGEALDAEEKAAKEFLKTLDDARKKVADQKREVTGWLKQLNDPHESALNRVSQNMSAIQDKTRSVLEANSHYHKMDKEFRSAEKVIKETLTSLSQEQAALSKEIEKLGDIGQLNPELARRVEAVTRHGSSWLAAGSRGPQTLVIPKSQFSSFLGALFGAFEPESASRDIAALREEILANPSALTQLLPGSKMVEMGEGASGFYLVYQSDFSTPHGLETTSQVTLGNVLNLWGNNISVTGHRFASPPSSGNAPFGDQGVSVQMESLQGENWVNYLNVTFHKFIQDIPGDISVGSQAKEARMMIFDDFALLLNDGKLYFGAAGFADFAMDNTKEKPYYYGGNFKASVKFTEVYSLNAEESILFANDPRKFLQTINLDFTKYDPDLDKDWVIAAEGENKTFRRDKVGVGVDLAKALEHKESFKLDLYFSRVTGTDDMEQNAVGATVLKGFSFDVGGTSVTTTVSGTGELGERYNTFSGRVSFDVPKHGIVLSAQGKMLGDADTYYLELRKKLGVNSDMFVSYGSKYVGLNHRLTIGAQTTFTLGDLWRAVVSGAADASMGGDVLKNFNGEVDAFFKRDDSSNPLLPELEKVFASDVAKRLLTMEVGNLGRDLAELYKAGALMDNTRMRGMIGFVTNPVAGGTVDRATSGGFQVGTQTELALTKSQRGLIESKIAGIYSAGVGLQVRLLELSKAWQASLAELVLSRWEAYLAGYMLGQADDAVLRADAEARLVAAKARHRQAQLRYNSLTGRGPDETAAFDLNPAEVDRLFGLMQRTLNNPHRLSELISRTVSTMKLPEESFNLADWIPFVEKVTFYVGAQLQDILAGQALGAGVQIRLPVYDPAAKSTERAMVLQNDAVILEMSQALKSYRLRAHSEFAEAAAWDAQAALFTGESRRIGDALWDAIRGYRNGLVPQSELWARFRRWHWNLSSLLNARAQGALKGAWAVLDRAAEEAWAARPDGGGWTSGGVRQPKSLTEGFDMAVENSLDWEALSLRSQAAGQLLDASSSRISKVSVDVNIGLNVTAAGVALIPAFGFTGLGIFPIVEVSLRPEELRQLSMERHAGEEKLYSRLQSKIGSDLALRLYEAYNNYRAGEESLKIYEGQVLPELDEAARRGGTREAQALDQGRAELEDLRGRQRQTLATINFLMGRPLKMSLPLDQTPERALQDLGARLAKDEPVAARRDVLLSRVRIAQAVETVVDKNLKVQNIRLEPISLIGRSLGRLVNALTGDGMPSPELVALARQQTLQAERDLEAFDRNLPAVRSRLGFELALAERKLGEVAGREDGPSRLLAVALRSKIGQLKAMLMAYGGGAPAQMGLGKLPESYGDLEGALKEAYAKEAFSTETPDLARTAEGEASLQAQGTLRYYYAHQNLAKEPIGKSFVEGWVEVRLRSASTPPEALVALAKLRQERADRLYASQQSAARAKADILLARMRLNSGLLRAAPEGMRGDLSARLERDFQSLAAHLRLPPRTRMEDVLRLFPEEGTGDAEAAARRYLAQVAALDLNMVRKTLFQSGLPESIGASADPLLQLRANMIAEKMSYKGFTPMAAFGLFRGTWVNAVFLEAPDPIKIQKSLENILSEALVSELKSQDKLKALALKLHSLMASVSDKVQLVEAQRARLDAARRNLLGVAARRRLQMATPADLAAAADEASASHEEFLEVITALHEDFVMLVTEIEALGRDDLISAAPGASLVLRREGPGERPAREQLLSYWSRRMMLDPDFERKLLDGELLAGVSSDMREELRSRLTVWRQARANADGVRADDFTSTQKLDLLIRTDVQGRRQKVEETLNKILAELSRSDPAANGAWIKLIDFLSKDVQRQGELSAQTVIDKGQVRSALRDAYWGAVKAPDAVEHGYRNLTRLSGRVDAARAGALERFLATAGKPEDYVLTDKALDEYVKALMAYDAEMVRVFSLPDVRRNPQWSRTLNGLFGLKDSLDRRRDYLRYGRGILSIDAAIQLGELRVNAFRREETDRRDLGYASEQLAFYQGMKQRWLAHPKDLPTVFLVKGSPVKDISPEKWLTARDMDYLRLDHAPAPGREAQAKRLFDVEGRQFLFDTNWRGGQPKSAADAALNGGREVVGGIDSAQERAERSRRDGAEALRRAERDAALKTSELVLTEDHYEGPGKVTRALSLTELRDMERKGLVFYFRAKVDPRAGGLRTALHPLSALEMNPADLVILVQVSTATGIFGRDKFPSLEALESSPERVLFQRVELGPDGVRALIKEAEGAELSSRRRGWTALKLEGYAYARDIEGEPAEIYVDEDELEKARETAKDPKSTAATSSWTFHLVSGLRIGLAEDGTLVRVEDEKFTRELPKGAAASRWIVEQPLALELDPEGRVDRTWYERDRDSLEAEAPSWHLEDTTGKVWRRTDKNISPIHRLKRYIDPKKPKNAILLGRALLARRLAEAKSERGAVGRWSYMPWNWANIILETPRGILKTPIELISGRDPNQEGYIGRVYMYRTEGGLTERRGVLGSVVHFLDIFELLPDHVDRFMDPSQFPRRVDNDGPILPGEWEHEKSPRTTDGEQNVHFGRGWLEREIRYASEDLADSKGRIMTSFRGGVRRTFIENTRGRNGQFDDTRLDNSSGRAAMDEALKRVGDRTGADGTGKVEANPEHIAVDQVTAEIEIRLGAGQHARRRGKYEEYLKNFGSGKFTSPEEAKAAEDAALKDLAEAEALRASLDKAARAATPWPLPAPVLPLVGGAAGLLR